MAARLRALLKRHALFLWGAAALFTFFRTARFEGWDDAFYVAQLTSAVSDHDLMLQNNLLASSNPFREKFRALTTILDSGALQNTFSIGPAVFHASYTWPFAFLGPFPPLSALLSALAIGSMAGLGLLVLATRELLQEFGFPRGLSGLSAGLSVGVGPLALYGTRAYLNSHLLSALFAGLLLLGFWKWLKGAALRHALLAGLAAGMLTINRWQDAVIVLGLLPSAFLALWADGSKGRIAGAGLAVIACFATGWLQLLAWRGQFGRFWLMPQGAGYMEWSHPHLSAFLFSPFHGLLPWAPGLALGLWGLGLLRGPRPAWLLPGLGAAVLLMIYLSACPRDWWGGASYGPRRLASLTPLAALGLAALLARLGRQARILLVGALCAWAAFTTTAYVSGFDDLSWIFRGVPAASNPSPPSAYAALAWMDRPFTLPKILRPCFTFTQAPRMRDRLWGGLAVFFVCVGVCALWNLLARSRGAQRRVLGLISAWILAAGLWLLLIPTSVEWNRSWRDVVLGKGPGDLPEGVEDAAHVILAVRALREGREGDFEAQMARVRRPQYYGVDRDVLSDFVKDPKNVPAPDLPP
jgi:hypothetical protein